MSGYSTLLRRLFLPALLKRDDRSSALAHWESLKKSQHWPRQQLLDYQWQKLTALLEHAYKTCPYYTRIFNERNLTPSSIKSVEDLRLLPILTRHDLYDYKDDLVSSQFRQDQLQQYSTGGTTGQRAVSHRNQESFNIKLGLQWRHEGWMGRMPCDKMIQLWPANMDFVEEPGWKEQIKDRYFMRCLMYQAGSAREEELRNVVAGFKSFKPEFIKVFPSALQKLAEHLVETNDSIPKVRGILSTGEPLYDSTRTLFENVFQTDVYDMYGTREVGNTACQCPEGKGLHIAMETQIVEFVKNGRPVEYGEEGEMLITDLTNYGAPMIRYQINDYGVPMKGDCACGRGLAVMSNAVGRIADDIVAPDGTRHSGHVLGVVLTFEGPMLVGQMQIEQHSLHDYLIRVTNKPVPTQDKFDYITDAIRKLVRAEVKIEFEVVDRIPREKSGKVRYVINKLSEAEKAQAGNAREGSVEDSGHR